MKIKVAKKMAKRFMKDRSYTPYGVYDECVGWNPTDGYTIKVYAIFPYAVIRELNKIATKQGWDGCHWGDPTIIEIVNM